MYLFTTRILTRGIRNEAIATRSQLVGQWKTLSRHPSERFKVSQVPTVLRLEQEVPKLSTAELIQTIDHLVFWKAYFRAARTDVPERLAKSVLDLRQSLCDECFTRYMAISGKTGDGLVEARETSRRRIELVQTWTLSSPCRFLDYAINNLCREPFNSRRTFRSITPAYFMDLLHILSCVPNDRLSPNFHKYYVVWKAFDLFDHFQTPEIVDIFQIMKLHSLGLLGARHPLRPLMTEKIMDRILSEMGSVGPGKIAVLLSPVTEGKMALEPGQVEKCKQCFKLSREQESLCDLVDIVALAAFALKQHLWCDEVSGLLSRCLAREAGADEPRTLTGPTIIWASLILQKRFAHREILLDTVNRSILASLSKPHSGESLLYYAVQAQHNVAFIEEKLSLRNLDAILMHKRVSSSSVNKQGQVFLRKIYMHPNSLQRANLVRLIRQLNGTAHVLNLRRGSPSSPSLDDSYWWPFAPSITSTKDLATYYSRFIVSGQYIYAALARELGGAEYVLETSLLPHFDTIDYVFALDADGNPVEIPQEFRAMPLASMDKVCPPGGDWTWYSFQLVYSILVHILKEHKHYGILSKQMEAKNVRQTFMVWPPSGPAHSFDEEAVKASVDDVVKMTLKRAKEIDREDDDGRVMFQAMGGLGT